MKNGRGLLPTLAWMRRTHRGTAGLPQIDKSLGQSPALRHESRCCTLEIYPERIQYNKMISPTGASIQVAIKSTMARPRVRLRASSSNCNFSRMRTALDQSLTALQTLQLLLDDDCGNPSWRTESESPCD